jgi:hypothetical protein
MNNSFNDTVLSNYLGDLIIAQSSVFLSILPEIVDELEFHGKYINELESVEGEDYNENLLKKFFCSFKRLLLINS